MCNMRRSKGSILKIYKVKEAKLKIRQQKAREKIYQKHKMFKKKSYAKEVSYETAASFKQLIL